MTAFRGLIQGLIQGLKRCGLPLLWVTKYLEKIVGTDRQKLSLLLVKQVTHINDQIHMVLLDKNRAIS